MAFDHGVIKQAVTGMTRAQTELEFHLDGFKKIIAENVNNQNVWRGESASAFLNRWEEFAADFKKMNESFTHQKVIAETAAKSYAASETK